MDAVSQQILEDLECKVCLEPKELRLLPCQHRFCIDCLQNLYSRGIAKFSCPECRAVYTRPPHSFQVDRLAKNIREQLQSSIDKTAGNSKKGSLCEAVHQCNKEAEARCSQCLKFICYRCIVKEPCQGTDSPHQSQDISDLLSDALTYHQELVNKETCEIEELKSRLDIKEAALDSILLSVNDTQSSVEKIKSVEKLRKENQGSVAKDEVKRVLTRHTDTNIPSQTHDNLPQLKVAGSCPIRMSYIKRLPSETRPAPLQTQEVATALTYSNSLQPQCVAQYEFDGYQHRQDYGGEDQLYLTCKKSERFTLITEDSGDGWSYVQNIMGVQGYLPTSYLTIKPPIKHPKPAKY